MISEPSEPMLQVADEEVLYRAVLDSPRMFPIDGEGKKRISLMAFNDAGRRPSVVRGMLTKRGFFWYSRFILKFLLTFLSHVSKE